MSLLLLFKSVVRRFVPTKVEKVYVIFDPDQNKSEVFEAEQKLTVIVESAKNLTEILWDSGAELTEITYDENAHKSIITEFDTN